MKKYLALLCLFLLLCLSACRRQEVEEPPVPPDDVEEIEEIEEIGEPLQLESLSVEISRGSLTSEQLTSAVKELPALLEKHLTAEEPLQIGDIRVTVGDSSAVTARALAAGNIDLAFLSTEGFLEHGGEAAALYGAAAKDGNSPGLRGLICAAPTEYGRQLDERAGSGKPLSWAEISSARWGVLGEASLEGYRCLDLWLVDNYEGARVQELPTVTVCGSEEDLFRAAAAGEIDALVIRDDARSDMEEVWLRKVGQTANGTLAGFGRTESIWQEIPVLDVTERICGAVVAIAPEKEALKDSRFTKALAVALEQILLERPDLALVLGAAQFAPVEPGDLDTMERLMYIESEE